MITPVSSLNFTMIKSPYNSGLSTSKTVLFSGKERDSFVKSSPVVSMISNKNLKEIYPIYLRYRKSANVESTIGEVKNYLDIECRKNGDNIIVARQNNVPIGFLHYGKELSTLRVGERFRLKALYVDKEYRRKGVAKKLIEEMKKEAKDREIVVKARLSNIASPNLYLDTGFKVDDEYVHLVYKNNKSF